MGLNLELQGNSSKLDIGGTGAAVIKKDFSYEEQQIIKLSLGKNKKIFDVDLWRISKAIKVTEQKTREVEHFLVISIFCNFQITINNLREDHSSTSQELKIHIY